MTSTKATSTKAVYSGRGGYSVSRLFTRRHGSGDSTAGVTSRVCVMYSNTHTAALLADRERDVSYPTWFDAFPSVHIWTTLNCGNWPWASSQYKKATCRSSPRLQRMRMCCSFYNFNLIYKPGKDLVMADCLSRAQLSSTYDTTDQLDEEVVHAVCSYVIGN